MAEEVGVMLQKGLAEWWSEETEYIFQRIERWAAYARGYNRLRSQRLSRGRMTMQDGQQPRWSISSNKLIIDDSSWSPRFHALKKSRRKSRPEESKINCCGTFNYQSNSNLDSTCLETYRYDHSIYFKTIGDIKNSKKEVDDDKNEQDRISISSEELVEWDVNSVSDFIANQLLEDGFKDVLDVMDNSDGDASQVGSFAWFNINLSKLELNEDTTFTVIDEQNNESNLAIPEEESNNNYVDENLKNRTRFQFEEKDGNDTEEIESFLDIRTTSGVGQLPVVDEDHRKV